MTPVSLCLCQAHLEGLTACASLASCLHHAVPDMAEHSQEIHVNNRIGIGVRAALVEKRDSSRGSGSEAETLANCRETVIPSAVPTYVRASDNCERRMG